MMKEPVPVNPSKSSRKPIISSKLPKAFSQPNKLLKNHLQTKLKVAELSQYKKARKLLSPIKQSPSKRSMVTKAIQKIQRIPTNMEFFQLLPTCRIRLQEIVTISTLKSSSGLGVLKKSLHAPTLSLYAIKELPVSSVEVRQRLVNYLKFYQNTQISGLVGINSSFWNSPEGCVSVVMEYLPGGSLQQYFQNLGSLPQNLIRSITKRLLRTLQVYHRKIGAHGGILPSQILFSQEGKPKLGPGLSQRIHLNKVTMIQRTFEASDDVFDLGCCLIAACVGGTDSFGASLIKHGKCCLFHTLENKPENLFLKRISKGLSDFLCQTTQFEAENRASVQELLSHSWFSWKLNSPMFHMKELMALNQGTSTSQVPGELKLKQLACAVGWVIAACEAQPCIRESEIDLLAVELGVTKDLVKGSLEKFID